MIRPSPQRVAEILRNLYHAQPGNEALSPAELARAIQRETTCSRATAFRAVADAVRTGAIRGDDSETNAD